MADADDQYFIANLVEVGNKPVFWKSMPKAGTLKVNNLP